MKDVEFKDRFVVCSLSELKKMDIDFTYSEIPVNSRKLPQGYLKESLKEVNEGLIYDNRFFIFPKGFKANLIDFENKSLHIKFGKFEITLDCFNEDDIIIS
jgi:hypothetical protein